MSYDKPCPDCGGMAWPDRKRCATCEIRRLENKTTDLRADLHRIRGERDHAVKAATKAVAEEVARLTRERDTWRKSAEERSVALALVQGALVDAGRPVGDAMDFGKEIAALAASRDEGERGFVIVSPEAPHLNDCYLHLSERGARNEIAALATTNRSAWSVVPVIVRRVEGIRKLGSNS